MVRMSFPVVTNTSSPLPLVALRLRRWALAVAWLAAAWLAAGPAVAQETLDQSNAPASWGGGAHHITTRSTQRVSPTLGCLTRVEIGLMTGNRGKGGDQVTLTVLDWNPYPVKELAKVTATAPEGFDGFLSFTMPGGGIVVPHTNLALQVNDSGKNVFWWKYQIGNPYPGGEYFFGGTGDGSRDYLFKTYGRAGCLFSLGVTPDPVTLAQGGTSTATIGVQRQGSFTGPVNVTLALPSGVTASPSTLTISGAAATTMLSAAAGAPAGSFPATANGTASGASVAQGFHIRVTAIAGPKVTSVTPSVQQRGGTISVAGSGFDPNCGSNMVSFAGLNVVPTACSAGALMATVPAQAAYGPTTLKVTSGGRLSNAVAFSVGRQAGGFAEITGDVLHRHTSRNCAGGTAKVEVVSSGAAYVASYRKVPGNSPIGASISFQPDFPYSSAGTKYTISNIGGAGFSLCSVGLVFDGGNGAAARLFLRDLETAADFQASPYAVDIQVPRLPSPYAETYEPRFFRSPDGTLILAVTAAPANGSGNVVAAFFDKAAGGAILKSVPITKPAGSSTVGNPAISAAVSADNRVTLTFGAQTLAPIGIP
jgi:hypothetical protein